MKRDKKYFTTIHKIVLRAEKMAEKLGYHIDRLTMTIDLDKANDNFPIDFGALLKAKDGDFAHDVFGIRKHMNRKTGKIEDCFLPRYAI
jgi:hypothetical protein